MSKNMANPVATHIGYHLRRASVQAITGATSALAPLDLRITPATVLLLIHANPDCRQSDLCQELGIKRANMTPIIAELAGRGWIDRSAIDGRSVAIRLTDTGNAAAEQVGAALDANEQRLRAALSSRALPGLLAALIQLEQDGDTMTTESEAA